MSNIVTKWAFNLEVSPTQKLVLLVLAHYANDDGTCFPSFNTLAKTTCLSRRSVIQQISMLEKLGVLTRISNDRYNSNVYQLNVDSNEFKVQEVVNDVHQGGEPPAPPSNPSENGGVVNDVHQTSAPDSPGSAPRSPSLVNDVHPNNQFNNQLTIIEEKILSFEPNDPLSPVDSPPRKKFRHEAKEVLEFLNRKTGKNFEAVESNLDLVANRMKEGGTVTTCKQIIAMKCRQWLTDEKMSYCLRPKTLFNKTNFWQYKGELIPVEEASE